jgi:hypothetical protein
MFLRCKHVVCVLFTGFARAQTVSYTIPSIVPDAAAALDVAPVGIS